MKQTQRIYDPDIERQAKEFPRFDVADYRGTREIVEKLYRNAVAEGFIRPTDERIDEIERSIPAAAGHEIPIRIYAHRNGHVARPCFVNFHGGGFFMGDLDSEHERCLAIAAECESVSIGVDYRLAPEHPFPAGVEDCYTAYEWVFENAESLGIDRKRIVIGGGSAGGNLTAAVALMARDRSGPQALYQMLFYPVIDDRCETPSMIGGDDCYIWNYRNSLDMWDHYLGAARDDVAAYAAPVRAENLTGLPPAYMITCEHDPLRDEAIGYAMRLMDAGVPVELHNYPGTVHGFEHLTESAISTRCVNEYLGAFSRAVG